MLKKSLFLMAILGMVAAFGFGESADDMEKAQRFRVAEYEVGSNESGACATATAEKADLALVSNGQLEVLGAASSSSWNVSSSYRVRRCFWTSFGWICF